MRTNAVILISIIQIGLLWLRILGYTKTYYDESVEKFSLGLKSFELFWLVGLTTRSLFLQFSTKIEEQKGEHLSLIYLALGQFPLLYCIMSFYRNRNERILVKKQISMKSDQEFELFIHSVWMLIKKSSQKNAEILLNGFIEVHQLKNCLTLSDHPKV